MLQPSVEIYVLNSLHCIVHLHVMQIDCHYTGDKESYSEDGTNADVGRILKDGWTM